MVQRPLICWKINANLISHVMTSKFLALFGRGMSAKWRTNWRSNCRCWSPSVCAVWNSLKMPQCHWIRISYSLRRSRCDFLFEKDRFLVSDSMTHGPARSNRRWGLPTIWRGSRGITASLLVQKNLSTQGGGRCLWHKMKIFWNVATHEIEYA